MERTKVREHERVPSYVKKRETFYKKAIADPNNPFRQLILKEHKVDSYESITARRSEYKHEVIPEFKRLYDDVRLEQPRGGIKLIPYGGQEHIDYNVKNHKMAIVEMSPIEWDSKVPVFTRTKEDNELRTDLTGMNLYDLYKQIMKNKYIHYPWMRVEKEETSDFKLHTGYVIRGRTSYKITGHEGRHRMFLARMFGIREVPVQVEGEFEHWREAYPQYI